jgi:hypothetical protein
MKVPRLLSALLMVASTSTFSQAQIKLDDYIVIDTVFSQGPVIRLQGQRISFQQFKNSDPVIYNAKEVTEYGDGGQIFESVSIDGAPKFLQRLATGKIKLYRNEQEYVINVESTLTRIDKRNFRTVIRNVIKCDNPEAIINQLDYSKPSLSNFVQEYNSGKCDFARFPYRKYGVLAGYGMIKMKARFQGSIDLADIQMTPTLGLFSVFPFYKPQSLFLNTEIDWQRVNPLFYWQDVGRTKFANIEFDLVHFSIDGKLFLTNSNVRAYLKAGVLTSWVVMSSSSRFVETIEKGLVVEIESHYIPQSSSVLIGFNSGVGVEIPYKKHHNFHLELKYLKSSSGMFESFHMSFSGLSVMAGYNF